MRIDKCESCGRPINGELTPCRSCQYQISIAAIANGYAVGAGVVTMPCHFAHRMPYNKKNPIKCEGGKCNGSQRVPASAGKGER